MTSPATPEADGSDPSAPDAPRSLGREMLAALRGTARDYTEGPIGTALLLLAVPMVLEMVMESVFAVVDVYWVASLGAPAVAAVGLTESVLSLMYAVAMGLSMAATAVVSRRIGEKDPDGAARAAVQAVAVAAAAFLFAQPEVLLPGAGRDVHDSCAFIGCNFIPGDHAVGDPLNSR